MRIQLHTRKMSAPTLESFSEYLDKKWGKIDAFIEKTHLNPDVVETKLKAEFHKRKKLFTVKAVMTIGKRSFVISIEDTDFRKAVDTIVNNLRHQLVESRGKHWLNTHH